MIGQLGGADAAVGDADAWAHQDMVEAQEGEARAQCMTVRVPEADARDGVGVAQSGGQQASDHQR